MRGELDTDRMPVLLCVQALVARSWSSEAAERTFAYARADSRWRFRIFQFVLNIGFMFVETRSRVDTKLFWKNSGTKSNFESKMEPLSDLCSLNPIPQRTAHEILF